MLVEAVAWSVVGLSPRLRGNPSQYGVCSQVRRSIPAPAGEPPVVSAPIVGTTVYPRACGGTLPSSVWSWSGYGLSPRLRGNLGNGATDLLDAGSIPAPAGGTGKDGDAARVQGGLSPRLRGNPSTAARWMIASRSIPAPAGEPQRQRPPLPCLMVYPRACGGTRRRGLRPVLAYGLSPRLRGNLFIMPKTHKNIGSIPAPAGEPVTPVSLIQGPRVYPRACGGTGTPSTSPLTTWVYPRACGGTHTIPGMATALSGLSPRLRGNQITCVDCLDAERSIPAPAGEPRNARWAYQASPVYPRACGGTHFVRTIAVDKPGLSPRLRGNPA